MNIEVVTDTIYTIKVKDDQDVYTEAGDVYGNHDVPVHGTGKPTVHHHDQPRGE